MTDVFTRCICHPDLTADLMAAHVPALVASRAKRLLQCAPIIVSQSDDTPERDLNPALAQVK